MEFARGITGHHGVSPSLPILTLLLPPPQPTTLGTAFIFFPTRQDFL